MPSHAFFKTLKCLNETKPSMTASIDKIIIARVALHF